MSAPHGRQRVPGMPIVPADGDGDMNVTAEHRRPCVKELASICGNSFHDAATREQQRLSSKEDAVFLFAKDQCFGNLQIADR